MTDSGLLAAASGFAVATLAGALVADRSEVRGEPFGVVLPGPVRLHVLVGIGSGLSAPWPMPAAALVAAIAADGKEEWPGQLCAGLGVAAALGALGEPVVWGRRSSVPAVRAAIAANAISFGWLVLAGRRALHRAAEESHGSRTLSDAGRT